MASNSRGIVIVHAAAGLYFSTAMTRARLATLIVGQAAVVAGRRRHRTRLGATRGSANG
jgi:hypothetical protein